ncbi:hypothetical protein [Amycolatopsis magusensis]|uniref:hypothetical protein n=1 Tax=Amycolatopsis magusensis TaxID=882444 RepID=UPI0024A81570|nr:hypothetical protein [Amycolatopsis magusensis]MDI5980555.1 hypothetical protein [Amycolatopsis magusensis]
MDADLVNAALTAASGEATLAAQQARPTTPSPPRNVTAAFDHPIEVHHDHGRRSARSLLATTAP